VTVDPLFVDVYPGDGDKDWPAFIEAGPPWHGAIFKLTQGLDYVYLSWAARQRDAFISSPRYGFDLWDGYYHYLTLHQDGAAQAERFWLYMGKLGGELSGTLPAMVDVERGGQRIMSPSRAQVEDTTRAFAARYQQLSGREATLYGGELLRSVGVRDRLGCGRSAIALYGPRLPSAVIQRTGTDLAHLMLWQYCGDGEGYLPGYPHEAPGCGRVDISAMVLPGGLDAMRSVL
jgi:GH25 family lysozyme M1 (1,4-beta-N-acetylmuramidase)